MKLSHILLTAVLACLVLAPVTAEEIVIESRREGKNNDRYKEVEGKWMDSQIPPAVAKSAAPGLTENDKCGSRKSLFTTSLQETGHAAPASAQFLPKVSAPGHYYVYVTWPRAANATPVYYTIKHAKGEEKKTLTQNGYGALAPSNADTWIPLGDYDFTPGEDQYVQVEIKTDAQPVDPKNSPQVYSDAVKFCTEPDASASASAGSGSGSASSSGPAPLAGSGSPGGLTSAPAPVPVSNVFSTPSAPTGAPASSAPPSLGASGFSPAPLGSAPPSLGSAGSSSSFSSAPPLSAALAPPPKPLLWNYDVPSVQRAAAQSGKKILVFFYTPDSETTQYYERTIFASPEVNALLSNNFELARLNFIENAEIASKLQVFKAGTINIYDSRGLPLTQIADRVVSPTDFASRLQRP